MREIFLIRHGETEWNAAGRYQGVLDSALTVTGSAQARAIGVALAALPMAFDAMVVSPLGRTRQTAALAAGCGTFPEPRFDARLAEVSTGSWDGLTMDDIHAGWPDRLQGSTPFDWYFRSPDGESFDAAVQRAQAWLDDVQGAVIAVSHGLFGRILRGTYLGLSRADTLTLPVPQDVVWRLVDGQIAAIATT